MTQKPGGRGSCAAIRRDVSVITDSTASTFEAYLSLRPFGKGVRDAQGIARRSDRGDRRGGVGGGGDLLPTAGRDERHLRRRRRRADGGSGRGGHRGRGARGRGPRARGRGACRRSRERGGAGQHHARRGSRDGAARAGPRMGRGDQARRRGHVGADDRDRPERRVRLRDVQPVRRPEGVQQVSRHPDIRACLGEQRGELGARDVPVSVLGREVAVRPRREGRVERRDLRHVHERLRHDVQQVRRSRRHVERADRGVREAVGRQAVDRREPERHGRLHRVRDRLRRLGGRLPQRRHVVRGRRSS